MKKLLIYFILFTVSYSVYGQSNVLCDLQYDFIQNESRNSSDDLSIRTLNEAEIYRFIEKLMGTVKLPMNFQVKKCASKTCRNNASASMDQNGTRYIKYDDVFFDQIKTDSTNIEVLVILAHEIGHHLSAHTLGLNKKNYEVARKKCNPRRTTYSRNICDSLHKTDYENYLYKNRQNELQADRFSGYIMSLYGASLPQIETFWNSIVAEKDDKHSTHPRLSKRLDAVRKGYALGEKYKNSRNKIVDIQEIKGYPDIQLNLKQKDKDSLALLQVNLEKQKQKGKLFSSIFNSISTAGKKLKSKSTAKLNSFADKPYTGNASKNSKYRQITALNILDKEGSSWESVNTNINEDLMYYTVNLSSGIINVKYSLGFFIYVNNGFLKIYAFYDNTFKVVYSSIFDENEISFNEIQIISSELLNDGFQKAILKYESE